MRRKTRRRSKPIAPFSGPRPALQYQRLIDSLKCTTWVTGLGSSSSSSSSDLAVTDVDGVSEDDEADALVARRSRQWTAVRPVLARAICHTQPPISYYSRADASKNVALLIAPDPTQLNSTSWVGLGAMNLQGGPAKVKPLTFGW